VGLLRKERKKIDKTDHGRILGREEKNISENGNGINYRII
jgi:hypothetical protein